MQITYLELSMFITPQLNYAVAAAVGASTMGMSAAQAAVLEEVIVTATKRAESLQDIAMSVTVMDEQTLERIFDPFYSSKGVGYGQWVNR